MIFDKIPYRKLKYHTEKYGMVFVSMVFWIPYRENTILSKYHTVPRRISQTGLPVSQIFHGMMIIIPVGSLQYSGLVMESGKMLD